MHVPTMICTSGRVDERKDRAFSKIPLDILQWEGGREGRHEEGREGGREGKREEGKEGGKER